MTELLHPDDALSALLDGELSADEAAAVRDHVAACADCAAELDAVRDTRMAVRSLPAVEPPPGFIEGLLTRSGAPDEQKSADLAPQKREWLAPVVPLRRRAAVANAAAAVAAGLLLVVGFAGHPADAVAPQVGSSVEQHAATLAAMSIGSGAPMIEAEVTPTTMPPRSTDLPRPYIAPEDLAGYRRVGAFRAPDGVQVLYEKDGFGLSMFEQEGELNAGALARRGTHLRINGDHAWRWDAGVIAGRVLVIERGDLVITLVGDESAAAVRAAADALPGSRDPSWATRFRRACGDALEGLSPAG